MSAGQVIVTNVLVSYVHKENSIDVIMSAGAPTGFRLYPK